MAAFASDFADLCVQTIVWQKVASRDEFGKPTYGPAQVYAPPTGGRRSYSMRRVASGAAGQVVDTLSDSQILVLADLAGLSLDDAVYVLGDVAPFPTILSIQKPIDETGQVVYTKVMLGRFTG